MESAGTLARVQAFYYLAKPGIIYGNSISAAAGFLLACHGQVRLVTGIAALSGTACVIGAGCVLNNLTDRSIDSRMQRTRRRALVQGTIGTNQAIVFAAVLTAAGFGLLSAFTNLLTVYIGILGLYFYVVVYGLAKRSSPAGTPLGSIAGATPILAGYTSVSGRIDITAIGLFLAMACWQLPHFYAIAMYRLDDYRAAGLPVLPAVKGLVATRQRTILTIATYALVCAGLAATATVGWPFLAITSLTNLYWLWTAWRRYSQPDTLWARAMFGMSLVAMLSLSAGLSLDWFITSLLG